MWWCNACGCGSFVQHVVPTDPAMIAMPGPIHPIEARKLIVLLILLAVAVLLRCAIGWLVRQQLPRSAEWAVDTCLRVVRHNKLQVLQWAAARYRSDRDIVLKDVKRNWETLEWAADSCKGDSEIVLAAVMQNCGALKWAAESCRKDRDIVLAAVQQNWQAIYWAGESCRNDREIVLTAVTQNWQAFYWAGEAFRSDPEI
eukprot:5903024-Amphidinium_carterae.1